LYVVARSLPDDELLLPLDGIDWQRVAQMVGGRSAGDCMSHWTMTAHPRVNKGPWTNDEDVQLVKLAKEYKERNWCGIAEQLQTNRTPVACLARYHGKLNRNFTRKDWTKEEDKLLREAVAVYGESSWQLVAEYVGERTGQQCLFRWTKSIDPRLKKGRWSAKEDKVHFPNNFVFDIYYQCITLFIILVFNFIFFTYYNNHFIHTPLMCQELGIHT
jgi:myb proto-oncogene protein